MWTIRCLPLVVLLLCAIQVRSQSAIQLQPIVTTGLTDPVFLASSHDGTGRLFIVQQNGIIKLLQPGATTTTDYLNISTRVTFGGERGLIGLAFHPQFSTNRRFFVHYTRAGDGANQIAEYRQNASDPSIADTSESIIITIPHPSPYHHGGNVAFGSDGMLYAGIGDSGGGNDPQNLAQNIDSLLGKMIRLDIDATPPYGIPSTNPYAGSTPGRDEIFAIGFRNPYRFSFDPKPSGHKRPSTGPWPLWLADVGQGSIEEIDIVTLGGNYGWRVYEGTNCNTNIPDNCPTTMLQTPPIYQYAHTGGRCSITGGYVYRGRRGTLPNGGYVYADYCTGEIFLYNGEGLNTAPVTLLDTPVNIVGFGRDDRGEIYVVSFGDPSGSVHKIVPAGAGAAAEGLPRRGRRR